jgi:hypothetical protein
MPYFYGVYLQSADISTTLDLIRFLGEPDSIRFSHITLRGPYKRRLSKTWVTKKNHSEMFEWKILLTAPDRFFGNGQNTVVIKADIGSLRKLFYKPTFPNGIPHLTLYDGPDRRFAAGLYQVLLFLDWQQEVAVSRLREIGRKEEVDQVFVQLFAAFDRLYREMVGDPKAMSVVRNMAPERRLDLIYNVLGKLHLSRNALHNPSYIFDEGSRHLKRKM